MAVVGPRAHRRLYRGLLSPSLTWHVIVLVGESWTCGWCTAHLLGEAEIGETFGASMTAFREAYFQLRLLGPAELQEHARRLREHMEEYHKCVERWGDALLAEDLEAAHIAAEEERLRFQCRPLHSSFMEAATQSMARRPVRH
ncbi:hypothetical protein ACFCWG_45655 [Streptomyces sp. NPDC056390]|uniref:hypothetical protein n=1 Tax=Streptomyces sp. NPDC056390 TaxID=3345806 RepID=UPI0035D87419